MCYTLHSTALVRMTISAVFFPQESQSHGLFSISFRTVIWVYALQAASKALKEREAALLTLHAIEADLEKRRHTIVAIEEEGQKVKLLNLYSDHIFLHAMLRMRIYLSVHRCMAMQKWLTLKVKYLCILGMDVGLTVPLLQLLHLHQTALELCGSSHFSCKPVFTANVSRAFWCYYSCVCHSGIWW